ncbi:MAG: relaxase/mobilization nuclease domain-containing protein [Desulfovibrio sp.]|nr:relaxase/mobilization nuclease domain-containing protein [Desulfovibrio sp.]
MISKRIQCQAGNDNYGRLASYIADASHQGEKSLVSWCAGCWAGDDYELAMQEVADTQALNTRSQGVKTYHLVVSFRPEDAAVLTPEKLKAIEERFAQSLGLAEHQRHCGVHVNTENIHMHVAYNLIHPEKLTRVEPWRDYIKRDKLCRELEQEYGLVIDNGRDKAAGRSLSDKAAGVEAHTGLQSFESYARDQGAALLGALENAQTWEDVHSLFARQGLAIQPRGAGLVVKDRHGRQTAKASAVHRDLSLKKLEERFGPFMAASGRLPESEKRYGAKPLQKAADRNQLWQEFQTLSENQKEELSAIRKKWREKREELNRKPMARKTRANMIKLARQYEAEEIHEAKTRGGTSASWLEFLRGKAAGGDETALAVLRSRHEETAPETTLEQQEQARRQSAYLSSKRAILESRELSSKTKTKLFSMATMETIDSDATAKISKHGSIIYTLTNGGKISDTGKSITFSEGARETALAYMAAKWGVRRRSMDRATGNAVFILASGQRVVLEAGKNLLERPKAKVHMREWVRSGIVR